MKAPLDSHSILPWENGLVLEKAPAGAPGVSIVIPIYNSGKFLEKTLRSLLCNDLGGCEIILMDGGSTDATPAILDHYASLFTIRVSERDKGQSDAINKGFARATQPILYWLNGDDILLPNALTQVRKFFMANPDCHFMVGDAYMTELDFKPIRHFVFSEEKIQFDYLLDYAKHHLVQPSVFFTRTAWDAAGPVKVDMHYAMDADLFLGMARRFKGRYLNCDLGYSVYHEDCKTRAQRAKSITELAVVQAVHGGIDHARRTLDILVDMYNALEKRAGELEAKPAAVELDYQSRLRAVETRAKALVEEVEKNKRLLLEAEINV